MSARRIFALAGRIITQFRRDRRTLGLLFVVPVVVLSLFAYVFRLPTSAVPLAVVVEEVAPPPVPGMVDDSVSERLTAALRESSDVTVVSLDRGGAESRLRQGTVKAILVIPQGFVRGMMTGQARVELILEGSNPGVSATVMGTVARTLQTAALRLRSAASGAGAVNSPLTIETSFLYGGKEFDNLDYFAPVYIAFFALFFVLLLTTVSFLRERSQGTMERLLATPLTRAEIVLGYMLGFGLFALIQSLVVLGLTIFALGIHYVGNPLVILLAVVALTLGGVNLGIFLSAFARTELQAMQFMPIVIVPQVFLSGFFWPLEDMPNWLQAFGYIMPLTYANRALRDVMLKGFGLGEGTVAWDLLALMVFAVVMAFLASITLRREVA